MARLIQETPCWTLYPSFLSILKTEQDRRYLEKAVMAYQCGRYNEAKELFDFKLPPSFSIPILAMQRADMLSAQGMELERAQLLKAALNSYEFADDRDATMMRLLLELMHVDANFWAFGKMAGLLDKARQIRRYVCQVKIDALSDLEVSYICTRNRKVH